MLKKLGNFSKNLFMEKTSAIACEILYQLVFGKGEGSYVMPDLHEANQHIVRLIEAQPNNVAESSGLADGLDEAAA